MSKCKRICKNCYSADKRSLLSRLKEGKFDYPYECLMVGDRMICDSYVKSKGSCPLFRKR